MVSSPRYTLYNYFRSSTSYRVRIALEWKGLRRGVDWRYESVHLLRDGGQQHSDDYLRLNPMREVPSLVIGDPEAEDAQVLAQSVAILEFLEEVHPDPPLLPADPLERARVRQVVEVVNSSIHPVQNLKVMRLLTAEFGTDRQANFAWAAQWIERHFEGLEALV
ncbi:MAG: glutathione S-transferase N-terminal domain-containing protein, partial [Myxococcota bacterium]|nr:glutathione S-transferase N-terminal domain-containing protein [Myxococcota bacterium]